MYEKSGEIVGLLDPGPELIILIFIIVILLFGARKIPELAKGLGRAVGEFKRGKMEVEKEIAEMSSTATMPEVQESKIVRAAKELGIGVEGESEAELRKEIAASIQNKDGGSIVRAAKALNINVEGVGVEDLRKHIAKHVS
ncbi:MAG: twin-arginine translocase TatA/TatE family subunit [Thermoplasmata archaeon]